ncbi:MAG: UDP-N-acetylglucosamine 2-epimerase [Pseudonocardia sp.]|nr:UDP-N-acetylglucosamine 2-epimerase [Pseudonocardia sp.]
MAPIAEQLGEDAVTIHIADLCCAPSSLALTHLHREGIPEQRVVLTDNRSSRQRPALCPRQPRKLAILREVGVHDDGYVLATVHRPENVEHDTALDAILLALTRSPLPVVLPVHPRLRPTRTAPRHFDGRQHLAHRRSRIGTRTCTSSPARTATAPQPLASPAKPAALPSRRPAWRDSTARQQSHGRRQLLLKIRLPGARCTTSWRGRTAARPHWATARCSVAPIASCTATPAGRY